MILSARRKWDVAARIMSHAETMQVYVSESQSEMVLGEMYRLPPMWKLPCPDYGRDEIVKNLYKRLSNIRGLTLKHIVVSITEWCEALKIFSKEIEKAKDLDCSHILPVARIIDEARNLGCTTTKHQITELHRLLARCGQQNKYLLRGEKTCELYERMIRCLVSVGSSWNDALSILSNMDLSTTTWRLLIPTASTLGLVWAQCVSEGKYIEAQKVQNVFDQLYQRWNGKNIYREKDVTLILRRVADVVKKCPQSVWQPALSLFLDTSSPSAIAYGSLFLVRNTPHWIQALKKFWGLSQGSLDEKQRDTNIRTAVRMVGFLVSDPTRHHIAVQYHAILDENTAALASYHLVKSHSNRGEWEDSLHHFQKFVGARNKSYHSLQPQYPALQAMRACLFRWQSATAVYQMVPQPSHEMSIQLLTQTVQFCSREDVVLALGKKMNLDTEAQALFLKFFQKNVTSHSGKMRAVSVLDDDVLLLRNV